MECILASLTPEHCLIYLDDIIFSVTFEKHLSRLRRVLEHLLRACARTAIEDFKCHFAKARFAIRATLFHMKEYAQIHKRLKQLRRYQFQRM